MPATNVCTSVGVFDAANASDDRLIAAKSVGSAVKRKSGMRFSRKKARLVAGATTGKLQRANAIECLVRRRPIPMADSTVAHVIRFGSHARPSGAGRISVFAT